ncbi:unnamed protein product [Prunus armeniaca]|uniref:Kinesin-like protein n=1 Tax=Prunus armeniaca TaxID=36596 RepID=A0A6J5XE66_PRUAR|nr:unnamed protein product [Prunus armeniaca]
MNTQSESHKDENGGSKSHKNENGGSKSHKDENGGFEIINGTRGENAELVESFGSTIEGNQILSLVEWLNFIVPYLRLPLDASEEELRACLIDGTVLCRILNKLCPGSVEMGGSSDPGFANITRFLAAVDELGFPRFELLDLEQGSMVPVLHCLSALKASFDFGFWGENTKNQTKAENYLLEVESLKGIDRSQGDVSTCGQQSTQNREDTGGNSIDSTSRVTDPSAALVHHIGQQLKQGTLVDLSNAKILESIKSTSLDNASTRSLFNVGNRILDDSIDRNNGDVPNRVAYLLRKVMQVIEQRFANQAVNLRIVKSSALFHQRISFSYSTVVLKLLQSMKIEKFDIEEKKKLEEQDAVRLKEEKDRRDKEISTLKQELEMAKSRHESHSLKLEANAKEAKLQLERRLKELECILTDSNKNQKELEASLESESWRWKKKEHTYQSFLTNQFGALKELNAALESTRHEILMTKTSYSAEFNYLGAKLKGLTDAAEKYHVVLDENRKLYNESVLSNKTIPSGQSQKQTTIEYVGENGDIVVANPSKQGKDSRRLFKFNKVFGPAATQEEVFLDTQPLIRSVLDGYNVCIFAYGQTGSGKTYTMSGPSVSSTDDWGVNYRALNDLFQISQSRESSIAYEVGVQMVEIYNEQVRDLLSIGATALNERSSRSHSVLTVHVRGVDLKTDTALRGSLHLVDLAGSERVDRSEATGDRLREAQHINKSLSALGDLNPEVQSFSETISTLKFAERVSGVELGAARSNREGRYVRELMEQVASFRDTIAKKDEEIERLLKAIVMGYTVA